MRLLLQIAAGCLLLMAQRAAASMVESGRIRGEKGEISLTIAVPLTINDQTDCYAWQHMASAMLAVDQFNNKDPVVVKELEQFANCYIRFVNVTVVDTKTNSHQAMKSVLKSIQTNRPPDAIAGPYNEVPALELSVMATGAEAPMVAFRGLDQNLVLPDQHPFYSQINPDLHGQMQFLDEFLKYKGRTDFVAIIYSNEDSVLQRMEVLRAVLKEMGVDQVKSFGYKAARKVQEGDDRGIRDAIAKIAKTGFRTIIVMTAAPAGDTPDLGKAAHEYELDRGGHFWVMPGGLDPSSTNKNGILEEYGRTDIGGFLRGMAYLYNFDGFDVRGEDKDPFAISLRNQSSSFVHLLREIHPDQNFFDERFCGLNFTEYEPGTPFPPDDILKQLPYLTDHTDFSFDATMAIGIGACIATADNANGSTAMTGEMHRDGIHSVDFFGASGQVQFGNLPGTPGSRKGNSTYLGVIGLVPPGTDLLLRGTDVLDPETQEWQSLAPFVYADGSNEPPPLRSQPEQNYLEPGVRAFGLTLMSIDLLVVLVSVIWVFVHRRHSVVIAAQPPFLYVLCLGSTVTSLVILLSSFDESVGCSGTMLDRVCVAVPWLASMGHIVTYSALFTKLWRVNKVLQFRRSRINISQVACPALFLIISATAILAAWTATSEFGWYREEVDELSGESIGKCKGNNSCAFLVPVGILCVIPTLLTGIMAWKTSDVDDMYSESKYIFSLILVQLQVIFVGVPIIAILQDVSPNGRFVGLSLLMSTFPLSTMGLIVVPKMFMVRRDELGNAKGVTRGSKQGVRVSGVPTTVGFSGTQALPSGQTGLDSSETQPNTSYPSNTSSRSNLKSPRVQIVTMQ